MLSSTLNQRFFLCFPAVFFDRFRLRSRHHHLPEGPGSRSQSRHVRWRGQVGMPWAGALPHGVLNDGRLSEPLLSGATVPRLFLCFGLECLRLGVWTGRDFDRNEKKLYGGIHRSRKTMWWTSEVSIVWSVLGCSLRLPGLTTMPKIRIFQQTSPFSERGLFGRQQTCLVDHVDPHTHHPVFCS